MALRQLLGGIGRGSVGSKRSRRSLRPVLEGLEKREVMTIAFTPAFGAETIFWRTNVAGHVAGTALTGPVSNPTALSKPTVYLIFSGSSWTSATASEDAADVSAILASPYLSGLTQYGSSGTATFGGYTIDNRTSPGPAGRDAEIQFALDTLKPSWQKPTGVAPHPTGDNTGATGYLVSPIYVVIDDNGDGDAGNGGGLYKSGGTTFLTNGINIDNGTSEDGFTDNFSHELIERISDGTGAGIGMNAPVNITGEFQNAQIADNEPDGKRYAYRLDGTVLVQAYWSVVDQAFIIPDGTQQKIVLTPVWVTSTQTFLNDFDLFAVDDAATNTLPASPMNAQKTQLSLGNESYKFGAGQIRNVSLFTLGNTGGVNQVWHSSGPGTSWSAVTGTNTHVNQLLAAGNTLYMSGHNGPAAGAITQVWKYSGSGTNWTAITGTNSFVSQIATVGNNVYMLGFSDAAITEVNQVWKYNGTGTGWTAITGINSFVSQIVGTSTGLYMLGTAGALNNYELQVWQYSGSGLKWAAVTGTNTNVSQIATTGSSLYMLANNGGANEVWEYRGQSTNWTPLSGFFSQVTAIATVGDRLFALGNFGSLSYIWQFNQTTSTWTIITPTGTTPSQVQAIGNGLYMVTTTNGVRQVWEYSGSGTSWVLVPATDPTYNAGA